MATLGVEIANMLATRGVRFVFGIPGVHNIELYRGIEEAGLTHVLARHEQGAGFMADGYARASGGAGVCFTITGPGLLNVLTALGQACSDSVPVLAISSCLDETAARRGQLHQMKDQAGAARTVCDWSEEAKAPEAAFALLDRAFRDFGAGNPGPKHIQVPISVLGAPAGAPWRCAPGAAAMPPDPSNVARTLAMLREARRPLLVLGGGAKDLAQDDRIGRLLRAVGFASFTTYAGRGIVAAGSPLHFGSFLARAGSARIAAEADLVLAIGTELSEVDLWRDRLGHTAPMIRVDRSEAALGTEVGASHLVRAGAAPFVDALLEGLGAARLASDWAADAVARARSRWRAEVDAERPGILPVADVLKDALPENTTIYSDMTQFAYAAKEVWDMSAPNLWHHPYGFGTLGYALPAAIGGKLARGAGPVAAIAGDYGVQYTIQELGTAVELGLALPIFLWDNGALGEIRDAMTGARIPPRAVHARNPDFIALARAYGARAAEPKGEDALRAAVAEALTADAPTLIRLTPATLG